MRLTLLYSSILILCTAASIAKAPKSPPVKKVLIVFLSRTNNTRAIAELIRDNVGGTMIALELEKPYPANYNAIVKQVTDENESGFLPVLKTKIPNIRDYDTIFIGYPTWGMQLPPPIKSFLHQYNLRGKNVIPFNTNAGYGEGSTLQTLKQLCPDSKILKGFTIKGGVERDGQLLLIKDNRRESASIAVKKWLQGINLSVE